MYVVFVKFKKKFENQIIVFFMYGCMYFKLDYRFINRNINKIVGF